MERQHKEIEFTGEYYVPGRSGERIEADHLERYRFACDYVKNKTILDIACGFGYASKIIIEAGAEKYEGIDISKQLIDNAISIYGADRISYYTGDICSYSPDRLFDVITCFETIEHVRDYRKALLNMYNLLNTDGLLIISSPNRPVTSPDAKSLEDKPSNSFHAQEFTIEEMTYYLRSVGFSVNEKSIYGQRLSILNIKNKRLNTIFRKLFGDSSVKASPKVKIIESNKIPRYFIVLASKTKSS